MVRPHAVFGALALFQLSWAGDPVNVAAFHGNNVTINCSAEGEDDSKSWEKDRTTIVSGDGQPDDRTKYSITKNNGSYNLGINNVQTTDAGEYMCGDKLAYRIVADRSRLDPDGKTDFKEGDTLGYRSTGNPIPTFNWTLNSTGKVFANTSRIKMTSAMSGQVLRSKAYNSVGRQAVTLNVTSVTAAPMNPDKDFAPACTGHPVLLAVVCLVIPMLSRP